MIPQNVCQRLCLITIPRGENIGKSSYFNLPDIGFTLFTPIKGRIDGLTGNIHDTATGTNILRYNTCMSSYPGDRDRLYAP
jgi:hypothetical protein